MNLHILFCPAQSISPDGSALPTAAMALPLDDEVQYRCAGFVQAEIERYAEELHKNDDESLESDNQDSEREQSEDETEAKVDRSKSKGKQPAKIIATSKKPGYFYVQFVAKLISPQVLQPALS
jgi:cohesin complex subunit SA-1/2